MLPFPVQWPWPSVLAIQHGEQVTHVRGSVHTAPCLSSSRPISHFSAPLGWSHLSGEDRPRLVCAPHRTPSPSLDPRLTISLFVPSPPYLTARHRGLGSSCSLLLPMVLCAVSPGSWEIGSVVVGGQTLIIKSWQEKLPCCLSPSLPPYPA